MNLIFAFLMGCIIALMILLNGTLSIGVGNYTATMIIHIVGLVFLLAFGFATGKKLKHAKKAPLLYYSAGAIGVATVVLNNLCFPQLGASLTLSLGLLGQSLLAILVDHFGLFQMPVRKFNPRKIIGMSIIVGGIILMFQ